MLALVTAKRGEARTLELESAMCASKDLLYFLPPPPSRVDHAEASRGHHDGTGAPAPQLEALAAHACGSSPLGAESACLPTHARRPWCRPTTRCPSPSRASVARSGAWRHPAAASCPRKARPTTPSAPFRCTHPPGARTPMCRPPSHINFIYLKNMTLCMYAGAADAPPARAQ